MDQNYTIDSIPFRQLTDKMFSTQAKQTSMNGTQLIQGRQSHVPRRGLSLVAQAKKNGIKLKLPGGSKNARVGNVVSLLHVGMPSRP